jgi:hypothetical protein
MTENKQDESFDHDAHMAMVGSVKSNKMVRLKDKKTGSTKGIYKTRNDAMIAHAAHPNKSQLVIEDSDEIHERVVSADRKTIMVKGTDGKLKPRRIVSSVIFNDVSNKQTKTEDYMVSFKDYKEVYESQEKKIELMIQIAEEKLREGSPFDWKNNKSEINFKSSDTPGVLVHKGTYGSDDHVAPRDKNKPKVKKSVGRPAGEYNGSYKIDRGTRGTKEYKDALSARVRAAKAENFGIRKEFKASIDKAIRARQEQINK